MSSQVVIKSHTKPVITSKGIFGNTEKISETIVESLTETEIARSSKEANKFAEPKFVDIPFLDKALKETIGDYVILRHKVVGLKATSITIKFDRLFLSERAELFIYNNEGTVITGPITAKI
jgi:sporulation protein YlmC with PRC-barrel domain